jgi:hypothetical protein
MERDMARDWVRSACKYEKQIVDWSRVLSLGSERQSCGGSRKTAQTSALRMAPSKPDDASGHRFTDGSGRR